MSSRDRASTPRKVAKITVPDQARFLNRDDERRRALAHFSTAILPEDHFSVLEIVGPGGAGKSRLLRELRDSALELAASPDRVVLVSLGAETVLAAYGPLNQIRRAVNIECVLYDTALLTYWQAMGHNDRLDESSPLANSLVAKAGELISEGAGLPLPLSFGAGIFAFLKKKWAQVHRYDPEEFEAIDLLRDTPEEIEIRLPEFLASDILRALGPDETLLAFYDGYERQKAATLKDRSPWLRTFIKTLGFGVHVIASREPLSWDEDEWLDVIDPMLLGPLPEDHSRKLIEARVGARLEEPIIERMLETSRCLPFFLEAIVKGLPGDVRMIQLDELPSVGEDPVGHLLAHLDEGEQRLVATLATIQVFDRELFEMLVRTLSLKADVFEFDNFIQGFYIEPLPAHLQKTHDILTQFVREGAASEDVRKRALRTATEDLPRRCIRNRMKDAERLLPIFASIVSGWYSVSDAPVSSIEDLIDAGYLLYDAGYWKEIGSLPLNEGGDREHPVSVAAEFFAALSARRTVGVDRASELFGKLEGRVSAFGRHQQSVELEAAYLKELGGDYAAARREFVALEKRIDRFDATSRLEVRSRLYLADMETMDGDLEAGSRRLLATYESEFLSEVDWAELVRHRGHALRFSFLFENAADLYLAAMRTATAGGLPALQAKLWTNLTETHCWTDPSQALKSADTSTELNERLGNRIELAKCEAARAISLAKLGCFEEAKKAVAVAQWQADRVGYPAGNAFALQAKAISLALGRETENAEAALDELDRSVASLGTYAHLAVAPSLLICDLAEFERRVSGFEWQEPEDIATRMRQHLGA